MKEPKQVILVRKDLGMSVGKTAAQVAHASMAVFLKDGKFIEPPYTPEMEAWMNGPFVKICLSVKNENQLLKYYELAQNAGLPRSIIKDQGRTEFNGQATYTTAAIGPADPDKINEITGKLQLLK